MTATVPPAGPVSRWWWVRLPRAAARFGPAAGWTAADGYWLTALPGAGALAPLLSLAAGTAMAVWRPGFEVAVTESLLVLLGMAAVGIAAGQLGVWLMIGFAAADLANGTWLLEAPQRWAEAEAGSWASNPFLAGLVFDRGPRIVHVLLLALLVIGVPSIARALTASLTRWLGGHRLVDLVVVAVLAAVAMYVVARLWAAAAPQIIRPLFTMVPPWEGAPRVPVEAITPLQARIETIARGCAVLMGTRCVLVGLLDTVPWARSRLHRVEGALLEPLPPRHPSRVRGLVGAIVYGAVGVVLLWGLLDDAWVAVVVFATLLVVRAARAGLLPLPTPRWRDTMTRLPLALRFGIGLLLVHGLGTWAVGLAGTSRDSFQFMVWPLLAGVVVLAVLLPGPPRSAGRRRRGETAARPELAHASSIAVVVVATATLLGAWATPVWADNCQTFSDCFFTAEAAATGLLGGVFVVALSLAIDLTPVGRVRGVIEGVTGRDLLTGQELTAAERALGLMPGGRSLRTLAGAGSGMAAVAGGWRVVRPLPPAATRRGRGIRHIFHGDINKKGKATGFHHRGSIGHQGRSRVVPGTQTPPDHRGVYRANVDVWDVDKGVWVRKPYESTFFPDDWSRQRVLTEIDGAFTNATFTGKRWRGVSPSGMRIEGFVDELGQWTTAYPTWP